MKLDQKTTTEGLNKYVLINTRKLFATAANGNYETLPIDVRYAMNVLNKAKVLDWGLPRKSDEHFTIKLKDMHSTAALLAYANSAEVLDPEFAKEVRELAARSGQNHPDCKAPD